VGTPLTEFLIGVCLAELGFLLFYLNRKHRFKEFADSHTILLIIMTLFITAIPVLAESKNYIYFIFPAYLFAINTWLFLTKNIVFKNDWQNETDAKKSVRRTYLILAFGSIVVLGLLIKGVPLISTQ
jgi:Na+/H+ antiporter NhaC